MGTNTPWGMSDHSIKIVPGVVLYSTPSHGGIRFTQKAAQKHLTEAAVYIAEAWGNAYWFEEDAAVCIVFYEHPNWYGAISKNPIDMNKITDTVKTYFPKYFEYLKNPPQEPEPGTFVNVKSYLKTKRFQLKPGDTAKYIGKYRLDNLFETNDGYKFILSKNSGAIEWQK